MRYPYKNQKDLIKEIKYIKTATVPVIKITAVEKYLHRKVDITLREFKDSKHNGEACVELIKDYIKAYKVFKPLILVLKQLIYNAKLYDPYQGGMSSYSLILMLVSYLQYKLFFKVSIEPVRPILGILFVDFFNFYGSVKFSAIEMKPIKAGDPIESVPILNKSADMLSITLWDPLNYSNNVTKSTYKVVCLENLFYFTYFSLFHRSESVLRNVFEAAKIYTNLIG